MANKQVIDIAKSLIHRHGKYIRNIYHIIYKVIEKNDGLLSDKKKRVLEIDDMMCTYISELTNEMSGVVDENNRLLVFIAYARNICIDTNIVNYMDLTKPFVKGTHIITDIAQITPETQKKALKLLINDIEKNIYAYDLSDLYVRLAANLVTLSTNQLSTNQLSTNQLATNQLATNQLSTNQLATNQSATNQSATNQSTAGVVRLDGDKCVILIADIMIRSHSSFLERECLKFRETEGFSRICDSACLSMLDMGSRLVKIVKNNVDYSVRVYSLYDVFEEESCKFISLIGDKLSKK